MKEIIKKIDNDTLIISLVGTIALGSLAIGDTELSKNCVSGLIGYLGARSL